MLLNVSLRGSDQMFFLGKDNTKKHVKKIIGDITYSTVHVSAIKANEWLYNSIV